MQNSKIEWTDHTLNFWHGCLKVSPGCEHCYADTLAKRWQKANELPLWGPPQTSTRKRTKGPWRDVLKWQKWAVKAGKRAKVFTMSMGDIFEDNPMVEAWRDEGLSLMPALNMLDFQLLTKRPENVLRMVPQGWLVNWPGNVWVGTSAEDQKRLEERINYLCLAPAPVRFLSVEPMIGPINLYNAGVDNTIVDWVIIGGESGHGARAMEAHWAKDLIQECVENKISVFFKQFGAIQAKEMGLSDKKGNNMSEFPDWAKIRQFPEGVTYA